MEQQLPNGIDLLYRFNPDGKFTYVNENARAVFNLSTEEILGISYLHFVREDYREKVINFYNRQIELKQRSTYFEFPFITGDKETWIGQTIELVCEDNEVRELIGVGRPITELRHAREQLRRSDQHLLSLLKHLDAAVLIEDAEGKIRYTNENFCHYFRLKEKPDELIDAVCAEVCAGILPLLKEPQLFVSGIEKLLLQKTIQRSERILMVDERVLERDYIPMFLDEEYQGHLWVYRDITMRYLTEQALIESEKKYREVIQNIDLGLMEVDKNETILWANDSFLNTLDYDLKSIQGKNAREIFLNNDAHSQETIESNHQLRNEGQSSVYELPIYDRSGKPIWMMISGAPIKDISGEVIGSLGIHHNITPLKELQNQLEYRLQLQSILLQLGKDLIFLNPEDEAELIQNALAKLGSFVKADRVYIFHYHLQRHTTSNTYEWCAEGINPEIANLQELSLDFIPDWYETHSAGKAMIYDKVTDLPEGNPVREILEPQGIQSIITVPIFGNQKLRGFIGFDAVRNLKEWNEDETELLEFMAQMLAGHYIRQEFETRLSASEYRMRTILENALDAVITINEEGLVENWNRQAEEIFKYKEAEVIGKSLSGLIIPEKFAAAHEHGMQHFIATGEGPVLNKRIELVGHDKNKNHFPIELSIVPFSLDGKYFFSSFLRDITARKQAEEDMNLALEQQKELARMKSRLISMASHEFRTPLTTIKANAEMLELWTNKIPEEFQAKAYKYLDRLNREINRLSNIMTDILVLGRLESGKIKISRKSLDLVGFIQDLRERHFSSQADGRKLRINLIGGPKLVSIDPELMEHVILNLVGNAFKYSLGAPDPELHLHYQKDLVRLSVKDYGIGIPLEDQNKIFNSFFRAENTRGIQGSGMGLSVVKQMADMQKLNLRFYSEEGQGSEFVLDIPLD